MADATSSSNLRLAEGFQALEAGSRPPVQQGVILFACPLGPTSACNVEIFRIIEDFLRPVEKSEVKACGSKNSFCRIILSGRGPFEVRRDVLNRMRMKRTWSQRLKILFTGKKRDNQGSSGLEALRGPL